MLGFFVVALDAQIVNVALAQPDRFARQSGGGMTGRGIHARPVTRRSIVRAVLAGSVVALTACSETDRAADTTTGTPSDSPEATEPTTDTDNQTPSGRPRVLVAYFSRPGENYFYGDRIDLEVGNTEVLARQISRHLSQQGVDCDVHRIEPADPYSDDYDETVSRNVREQNSDARPEIANPLPSIDDYDVVLLGSPIWNVRPPMIMRTFAESYDFTGKTVHPFTTHAMSGLGTAERDYTAACRNAAIGEGLAVQGEKVRDAGPPAVASWLTRITLAGEGKP